MNEEEREELISYLDGEVDEETARSIEARITVDPRVRAEVDSLKQAWDLLDYLPRPDPSPNFTNATLDRLTLRESMSGLQLRRRWGTPLWVKSIGWVAALFLAAGVGFGSAYLIWGRPSAGSIERSEVEKTLIRDLRIIENKHLYENVEDLDFLEKLDRPELFGEEGQ